MLIIQFAAIIYFFYHAKGGFMENFAASNVTSDVLMQDTSETKVLSRRKRFLVFPEGSSLQLVFCNTFPSINVLGNIILFGYTSALAYELPQDPYSPFDHHADPLHRRVDSKAIFYLNEAGKIIHKAPYERKFIVNPAFAKRSVDSRASETERKKEQLAKRQQMHDTATREFLRGDRSNQRSVEFHRISRVLLYKKIETMLEGLGGNGQECLLRTLCLVGKNHGAPQGSFFHEILIAVFSLPKGHAEDDEMKEYDEAHGAQESCEKLYPDCKTPLKSPQSSTTFI